MICRFGELACLSAKPYEKPIAFPVNPKFLRQPLSLRAYPCDPQVGHPQSALVYAVIVPPVESNLLFTRMDEKPGCVT